MQAYHSSLTAFSSTKVGYEHAAHVRVDSAEGCVVMCAMGMWWNLLDLGPFLTSSHAEEIRCACCFLQHVQLTRTSSIWLVVAVV